MDDRRQRHVREIAQRNLQRARREAELRRGAADRLQARAVGRRVAKLPDAREADLAPEVPADHAEAGRAAIHLVDLPDVLEASDARLCVCGRSPARRRRARRCRPARRRLVAVQRDLVVRGSFGRQQFRREIERHPRFRLRLILREPFLEQLLEFRIMPLQVDDRLRVEREQPAIGKRLDRGGALRAVQDRELAEEIAVAIEGEVRLLAVRAVRRRARGLSRG